MLEQILAAFFVLSLLLGTLWLLRRKGLARVNLPLRKRLNGNNQLEILERASLSAQHSLHLVRVQNRTILIGVSPSGCSPLLSFSDGNRPGSQRADDKAY
jgi:flagellar biosynthetic protein FliO